MTVRNNDVIAYVKCRECEERASLHMVMRGSARLGDLYTRNCECGCNQSGNAADQKYWRDNAEPVANWKDLVHPDFINIFDQIDQVQTDQVQTDQVQTDQVETDQTYKTDQVETVQHEKEEQAETLDSDQVQTDQTDQVETTNGKALFAVGVLIVTGVATFMGFKK